MTTRVTRQRASASMLAARLHGPSDLRVERVPHPGAPGPGEALLRVRVTGICGSDLHTYQDARIGDTPVTSPLVLGHEFSAVVEALGRGALDGWHRPLRVGARVAVDPAQPCGHCESCAHGHPNLCPAVAFCGCHPYGGSLCEWIRMPACCCFPVPDAMDDETAALLEPLGVALHAVDLGHLRVGDDVAVLGAGPIGLLIVQLVLRAGAARVLVTDPLGWRLRLAGRLGAVVLDIDAGELGAEIGGLTKGRGVDVVFEAAWGDSSVETAAELAWYGGRVVLVGIPSEDRLGLKHSTARRKGLTLVMSRRMKHVYPRCLRLATEGDLVLGGLVTHRYPLAQAAAALALNSGYQERVVKVMVTS
jgi:L-iditol 2-dehydrogenase